MYNIRTIRYCLFTALFVWTIGFLFSIPASAATSIQVLAGQGSNPIYDFGMAVGASGGNNKFIAGDFDGDGDTDLVNRSSSNTGVQFWRNNGNGTFTERSGSDNPFRDVTFSASTSNFSTLFLATGDFDGDGDLDVFNGNHQGSSAMYRNDEGHFAVLQGAGTNPLHPFGTAVGTGSLKTIAADFDGDGDTDLVNRNTTSTGVQYWRNNGNGTFTELTGSGNPLAGVTFSSNTGHFTSLLAAAGDFDGDGDIDIFNGNHEGTSAMYRNDGGHFTILQGAENPLDAFGQALGATTGKFVAGDFNGDGWVDLANRNSTNTGVQFWKNNGDGTITEQTGFDNPFAGVSFSANVNYFYAGFLEVGDFDGDGDTDIVNVNHGGVPALYQQSGAPPKLTGSIPADDAASFPSTDPIQLTFNEEIATGGPGHIEIRKYSDDSLVESIPGNSAAKVSGFGTNIITIQHASPLEDQTEYYMLINKGAFFDSDGQSFMGITKKEQFNFTAKGGHSIQPYPVRSGAPPSTSYTLSVNGQNVFVEKFGDISFARFSFTGTADVTVNASETIASYGISPQSYQIQGTRNGSSLTFSVDRPRALMVSVNNLEKLFLFADGPETGAPSLQDSNVINLADYLPAGRDEETAVTAYFQQAIDDTSALNNGAGGVLYVPDGKYMTAQLRIKSNVHLYLQSGAWIRAVPEFTPANYPAQHNGDSSLIFIGGASHVKISGRGFIDGNGMAVRTLNSRANLKLLRTADVTDFRIDDVYFIDSARWSLHLLYAKDVTLNNFKLINDLRGGPDPADPDLLLPTVTNTDGVDIDSSQNVTVEGAFIYTGDDAISPKVSNYMNLKRPTSGLQIKNNVLWTLKAALKVGDETQMDIGDIRFENNDVIRADRFVALWAGDETLIQNIDVINNRAEFTGGNYNERFFYFRIRLRDGTSKPGWIDQVNVKNFYALNEAVQPSTIEGFDESHRVTNVTFDNIVINGIQAAQSTDVPLTFTNDYYNNVVFLPSGMVYNGMPPAQTLQILAPTNHSFTNNPAPQISGTAMPNSTVRVYIDSNAPVTTAANASGSWSYTPNAALPEGPHTVKAATVDAAGNESQRSGEIMFTIDRTAPSSPIIAAPAHHSHTTNNRPTISGTAEGNSTVKVYVDSAAPVSVPVDANGNWSYTPAEALIAGPHSVRARTTDPAGNASADSGIVVFTVDASNPIKTTFVEAEAMTLAGYSVEAQPVASGGKVIKVSGTGTAATLYNGDNGTYDLKVHYFDENDGAATYKLFVNGNLIDAWTANQDLGSASVSDKSRTSRFVSGISLRKWDQMKLEGTSNGSEAARVDRFEFMLMAEPDPSATGSITGAVYTEKGTPLADVHVQATRDAPVQEVYQAYTDSTGQYTIGHIPEGIYQMTFHKGGYLDHAASDIHVTAGSAVSGVNVTLQASSNPPYLDTVQVGGSIPALTAGGSGYNLNGLSVTGKDQYGNSYDLTGLPSSWTVKTGSEYAVIDGTTLTSVGAGTGTVTLTVDGKESNAVAFTVQPPVSTEPRVLLVDRRGLTSGAYGSIAEAVASTPALKPGDIISLVPGSGPYDETIKINVSGTPDKPIIFEGNGELISGFTPFQFTQEANGQWTYTLPASIPFTTPGNSSTFRHLVAYNGQRLLLDQAYGQNAGVFTSDYAVLSSDGTKLILNPDKASPTSGWEISTLSNGLEIDNPDSYQTYRNVRITGMQNDGFNIHGNGTGLRFENIEAFNNFDEGYSSHDSSHTIIDGGVFWGNENGIYNMSSTTIAFTANNVKIFNNIGFGLATQAGSNSFSNVEVWDNGISNIRVGGNVHTNNVVAYNSRWSQRPWVGYQESQDYIWNRQISPYAYSERVTSSAPITKTGTPVTVLDVSQLPAFKGSFDDWRHIYFSPAQQADPSISGPDADPDGDGLTNLDEYAAGLNPNVEDVSNMYKIPPVTTKR